jgi:thiamine pyrophosphokinase
MNMRALIIGSGNPITDSLLKRLSNKCDLVIAADAGAELAFSHNLKIDAVVGDLDSISTQTWAFYRDKSEVEMVQIPEQDSTDLEKAINFALTKGAREAIITAVSGSRNDHFLHSLGLLFKYASRIALTIADDTDIITLHTASFVKNCRIGERISLIPFGGTVRGVSSQGLRYSLKGVDLIPGIRESVSNETVARTFQVTWEAGELLLFRNTDSLDFCE